MKQKMITGKKFYLALILFSLVGQVAWVVENMFLNVFIYKMFAASAADISMMVSASAIAATLTTIVMGAFSDKVGKRKIFICGGYIIWGISILSFGFVRMDVLTPRCGSIAEAAALGVTIVILLDCVMTFFGSTANDAAFNAWLTDVGDESNRGKIEGINAMMPLIAILVVFGGFMGVSRDSADSWMLIFTVIGVVVLGIGLLGIFLIQDVPCEKGTDQPKESYWQNLIYSFRPSTIADNKFLYAVLVGFAVFGISIQIFMPYLLVYYEQTLHMPNYVLILAPAVIVAAIFTVVYGRLYDQLGFQKSIVPTALILIAGYVVLFFTVTAVPVFVGSLLMMCGYLSGMAVFGAIIRDRIPESMAGRFQGVRIIGQVLIPGVIGPWIGACVLRDAAQIENQDGTFSFLPDRGIWSAAIVVAIILLVILALIFHMVRRGHYNLWTEAGEQGKAENGWDVHPDPQMKRENYMILSKGWTLNGKPIKMPFPPESILSAYKGTVGTKLTYEVAFELPETFSEDRILLHFGAVDQIADVWVNGKLAGHHEGGYLPFALDITALVQKNDKNQLRVQAMDTLDKKYPYGKQCKKRGGMWYTPVSGIWQPVWIENVPKSHIQSVKMTPDLCGVDVHVLVSDADLLAEADNNKRKEQSKLKIKVHLHNGEIWEQIFDGLEAGAVSSGENVAGVSAKSGVMNSVKCRIQMTDILCADGTPYVPKLWSPEEPYLYNMELFWDKDVVHTYFALRQVEIKSVDGIARVCLNEKPVFWHGVLDQGYYSDGIYLPAEPAEYERDVLRMKELGFNMLRKHIKVEQAWFYYYCDKHGMFVMQDMVNNGGYSFLRDTALPTIGMKKRNDRTGLSGKKKEIFISQMQDTITHLYNHPSVVAYTIFNEGWGQFESDQMYELARLLDDTRLYDATSGWFAQEKNDFDSEHIYFKTIDLEPKERPLFVTECGGFSRVIDGHYYSKYNTYGYGSCEDEHGLTDTIESMYQKMILPGVKKGVCGCIYTQLSDVEDEVNGLYTYDRKVCKVDKAKMRAVAEQLKL